MSRMTKCWPKLTNNRTHLIPFFFSGIAGSNYIIHFTPYTCKHNLICLIVASAKLCCSFPQRIPKLSYIFSSDWWNSWLYVSEHDVIFLFWYFSLLDMGFFSVFANLRLKIQLSLQLTPAISMLSKRFQNNGVPVQMRNTFDIDFVCLLSKRGHTPGT